MTGTAEQIAALKKKISTVDKSLKQPETSLNSKEQKSYQKKRSKYIKQLGELNVKARDSSNQQAKSIKKKLTKVHELLGNPNTTPKEMAALERKRSKYKQQLTELNQMSNTISKSCDDYSNSIGDMTHSTAQSSFASSPNPVAANEQQQRKRVASKAKQQQQQPIISSAGHGVDPFTGFKVTASAPSDIKNKLRRKISKVRKDKTSSSKTVASSKTTKSTRTNKSSKTTKSSKSSSSKRSTKTAPPKAYVPPVSAASPTGVQSQGATVAQQYLGHVEEGRRQSPQKTISEEAISKDYKQSEGFWEQEKERQEQQLKARQEGVTKPPPERKKSFTKTHRFLFGDNDVDVDKINTLTETTMKEIVELKTKLSNIEKQLINMSEDNKQENETAATIQLQVQRKALIKEQANITYRAYATTNNEVTLIKRKLSYIDHHLMAYQYEDDYFLFTKRQQYMQQLDNLAAFIMKLWQLTFEPTCFDDEQTVNSAKTQFTSASERSAITFAKRHQSRNQTTHQGALDKCLEEPPSISKAPEMRKRNVTPSPPPF